MTAPLGLFGSALRQAARGGATVLQLVAEDGGSVRHVDAADWLRDLRPGDESLLERCLGSTLDVGCGPGRLSAALANRGRTVLGVDVSAEAVRQARERGAPAMRGDVFAPLPSEGRWHRVLLADGNIGIGGDPRALLARCASLMDPDGQMLVELDPPGDRTWRGPARLHYGGRRSAPFPWAGVATDAITSLARRAGLRVTDVWTEGQRWFARLSR
jgi:SAM-dependent methyltransferase